MSWSDTRYTARRALIGAAVAIASIGVVVARADETIVLKGDGSPVTAKSKLQPGTKLTISGDVATQHFRNDAFYEEPTDPNATPAQQDAIRVKSASSGSTTQGALDAFLSSYPAYQPSHVYHVVVDAILGSMAFACSLCAAQPATGSFGIDISGPGSVSSGSSGGNSKLSHLSGKVEIQKSDGAWQDATDGIELEPGDKIHTGFKGSVTVTLPDGSTTVVEPLSLIVVGGNGRGATLRLGEIKVEQIDLRNDRGTRRYTTPTTTASVRGTRFSVLYDGTTTVVSVTQHAVLVKPRHGRRAVTVRAGHEVASTTRSVGPVVKIGRAGAPKGSVGPAKALALLTTAIAPGTATCNASPYDVRLKPTAHGWTATAPIVGATAGTAVWKIDRKRVAPANALATMITSGCR